MRGGRGWALGCVLALAVACGGGGPAATQHAVTPADGPTPIAGRASDSPSSDADWTCDKAIPPTGYQQEIAFESADASNPLDKAMETAVDRLTSRLCQGASRCEFVRAHVSRWQSGKTRDRRQVCVMAVIKNEEVETWRNLALTLKKLDDDLAAAASELLPDANAKAVTAIADVKDYGTPGGPRATWLAGLMERALQAKASVKDPPKGWAGDGVPSGWDTVVRGQIQVRSENGVKTVEVIWSATSRQGTKRTAKRVAFPEDASPHPLDDRQAPTLPETQGLSIRMDSMRGGSLCAGDRTQLWLRSESTLHARVFNLYGKNLDEAILIFPNEEQHVDEVEVGKTVALGGKYGFEAVPVPGSEAERYLVIAAPTVEGLGRFKNATRSCRVRPELAKRLAAGGEIPTGAKAANTGYRVITGGSCSSPQKREGIVQAIEAMPWCDFP